MAPPFPKQTQARTRAGAPPPPSQQNMLSNPSLASSSNTPQNPFQVQSQNQIPFRNASAHTNKGHGLPVLNMHPTLFQPGLVNSPNHFLPLQNNHLRMPYPNSVSPAPQPNKAHMGFAAQAQLCNLMQSVNPVNSSLPPGHLYGQNLITLPQQLNQIMGLSNGQFSIPGPYQNMNQQVPVQMSNMSQVGPYNAPLSSHNSYGGLNQVPQAMVPQNPSLFANQQLGIQQINQVLHQINQNLQNMVPQNMDSSALRPPPVPVQQLQGNAFMPFNSSSIQQQQANTSRPPGFAGSQANSCRPNGSNTPNFHQKNFTRNSKGAKYRPGFQKEQFHHMRDENNAFGSPNKQNRKGFRTERPDKFSVSNSRNQVKDQRRFRPSIYTEREIEQWREERRKNYPSRANVQKKLTQKQIDSTLLDEEARLRRQQLKEILAKQAELGVEVAELPLRYLSDSERQQNGRGGNRVQPTNKKRKFQNRFDKRGRYDKNGKFSKKAKLNVDLTNAPPSNKTKPTLLQKLMSADIKRDKSHLFQAFRFMVMNSFFKDWPDKPLVFPNVIVNENGSKDIPNDEKLLLSGNDVTYENYENKDNYNDGENDEHECEDKWEGEVIHRYEEEEGEITT